MINYDNQIETANKLLLALKALLNSLALAHKLNNQDKVSDQEYKDCIIQVESALKIAYNLSVPDGSIEVIFPTFQDINERLSEIINEYDIVDKNREDTVCDKKLLNLFGRTNLLSLDICGAIYLELMEPDQLDKWLDTHVDKLESDIAIYVPNVPGKDREVEQQNHIKLSRPEEKIMNTIGNKTMMAAELLMKADLKYNSHNKQILANLCKNNILINISKDGYRKP